MKVVTGLCQTLNTSARLRARLLSHLMTISQMYRSRARGFCTLDDDTGHVRGDPDAAQV
jgi:hypothetical protein